jgi:hypothetical protein
MARVMCYRCFWPKSLCWCSALQPMETRARFLFLMHPKEYKQEKAATGRLTHLCLPNSCLHMGTSFNGDQEVQAMLRDPRFRPLLFYPGTHALNLSGNHRGRRVARQAVRRTQEPAQAKDTPRRHPRRDMELRPQDAAPEPEPSGTGPGYAHARIGEPLRHQAPAAGRLPVDPGVRPRAVGRARCGGPRQLRSPGAPCWRCSRGCRISRSGAVDPSRTAYRRGPYSDPSGRKPSRVREASRRKNYLRLP